MKQVADNISLITDEQWAYSSRIVWLLKELTKVFLLISLSGTFPLVQDYGLYQSMLHWPYLKVCNEKKRNDNMICMFQSVQI